jgi:hypothetical protein
MSVDHQMIQRLTGEVNHLKREVARLSRIEVTANPRVNLATLGAVPDGKTDLAPVFERLATIGNPEQPGHPIDVVLPPGLYNVRRDTPTRVPRPMNILGYGAIMEFETSQCLRADASYVSWEGVMWRHLAAADGVSRAAPFYLKTLGVDQIQHNTHWAFTRCVFDGVGPIFRRVGSVSVQGALLRTAVQGVHPTNTTIWNVASTSGFQPGMHVRVGPQAGTGGAHLVGQILDVYAPTSRITLDTPSIGQVSNAARFEGCTVLTGAVAANDQVLQVASSQLFPLGSYARVQLTSGSFAQGVVIDRTTTTLTLDVPLGGVAAPGLPVLPMNDGVVTTGADIAAYITLDLCEIMNVRSAYGVGLAGVDQGVLRNCSIHHVFSYTAPNSGIRSNATGEGVKISSGSTGCEIIGGDIWFVGRNALDCFDARQVRVSGVTMYNGDDSLVSESNPKGIFTLPGGGLVSPVGAVETKENELDRVKPRHMLFDHLHIHHWAGHGMIIGVDAASVSDTHITDCGGIGLYGNGRRPDVTDDETGDIMSPTSDIQFDSVLVERCGNGIVFTEVIRGSITGGRVLDCARGLWLGEFAREAKVTGLQLQGNTTDLYIQGNAAIATRHQIDALFDSVTILPAASFVAINNYGEEAAGVGAQPSLANWQRGNTVKNTSDGTIWHHQGAAMQRVGGSTEVWFAAAQPVWNDMNGEATDVLTAGTYTVDLNVSNGVPTNATKAMVMIEARWSAASSGNNLTITSGLSGALADRIRAESANFPYGRPVEVGLSSGQFQITAAGVDATHVTVRLLGYTV